MKLIILLVVLGAERYLGIGEKLKRFCWFDRYLGSVQAVVGKQRLFQGFVGAIITILPIPIVVTLISCLLALLAYGMHSLVWLTLNIFVLFCCLGPKDIYRQVYAYINPGKDAADHSTEIEKQMLDGASAAESHAMTKAIFWQANQSLFSVLFWFMLFGMFGALFYRCTTLLRQSSKGANNPFAKQHAAAEQIQNILDWVPVRIFTLFFALVGQFSASFTYWLENIVSGLSQCRRFISESGLISLGVVKSEKGSEKGANHTQEYHAALSLIDRALIVFLAIVALFTVGSWIY